MDLDATIESFAMDTQRAKKLARFKMVEVEDKKKTKETGVISFKDEIIIELVTPGKGDIFRRRATVTDMKKFPEQWAAFKNNATEVVVGTPIKEWPAISRVVAEQFIALGIRSVEDLASITDANAQKLMGGYGFREKARNWVAASKKASDLNDFEKKVAERDSQIEKLMKRLDQLEAKNAAKAKKADKPEEEATGES